MVKRHRLAIALITSLSILVGGFIFGARALPFDLKKLRPQTIESTRIYDRNGALLREKLARPDGRAYWIHLEKIPKHLINATLVIEDKGFYKHRGVDYSAVLRALLSNIRENRVVSGASTLTMQLIKLVYGTKRSFFGKLKQSILATRIEHVLSKDQILEQYFNRAPFGFGSFGVQAASKRYFGKPAAALSLAESAALAALPKNPTGYNPRHKKAVLRLIKRQRKILILMYQHGRISKESLRLALAEKLNIVNLNTPFGAPHFTDRIFSFTPSASSIKSTIDLKIQKIVEHEVSAQLDKLKKHSVDQAAVIIADNRTGEILAYLGSNHYWKNEGQFNGATALRQPGSTIKPFAYAYAFEKGLHPATILKDLPSHFSTEKGSYTPRNYDGRFHGPTRARIALANSYNVPAVNLANRIGVNELLAHYKDIGLNSLKENAKHYGLGIVLGNGEITLEQLVQAYMILARGGTSIPLRFTKNTPIPKAKRIYSQENSYLISHILSDPLARSSAFGRYGPLETDFFSAAKTGTSTDFRDNWTVGYTNEITVGVWVGNFDGSSMHGVSGITGAAPLWASIMKRAHDELHLKHTRLNPPKSIKTQSICALSGQLAGSNCPSVIDEIFSTNHHIDKVCSYHRRILVDPNGNYVPKACAKNIRHKKLSERTLTLFPPRYQQWANKTHQGERLPRISPLCKLASKTYHRPQLLNPKDGDHFIIDPDIRRDYQKLSLQAAADEQIESLDFYINGKIFQQSGYPFSANWPLKRGEFSVEVRQKDGQKSDPIRIRID